MEEAPGKTLTPVEATFRHSFWAGRRDRVRQALHEAGASPRRIFNFCECGAGCIVMIEQKTGQVATRASHCHDRFCEACQQHRGWRIQQALRARVPRAKCLHVVLTLASSDQPLEKQIDRLYKSATKLRASKWWKRRVKGGSQTFELTRNVSTGQWHPHLHLLVHADWIPKQELSDQWHKVTGDSLIVDVSLVQRTDAAVREVTKYLAKPIHRSVDYSVQNIALLIRALHRRHMITTFGTWRNDPLLQDDADEDGGTWKCWGSLNKLHSRAAAGDTWARQALAYLASLRPGRERRPPPPVPPSG